MLQVKLSSEELDAVLKRVSPNGREFGASRICRLLAVEPGVRTRVVNQDCSVGNISDLVSKAINPKIEDMGLYVACIKPLKPFKNRYNQTTGEMLWSFYRDAVAANDPDYDDPHMRAMRDDLDSIDAQHPELNRWEDAIEGVKDDQGA
jgi:hypothetical protein